MSQTLLRLAALSAVTALVGVERISAQGFNGSVLTLPGGSKAVARIHRKLPAAFVLPATDFFVHVVPTAPGAAGLTASMTPLVETTMQQYDTRLSIDDKHPQILITCTITGYLPPRIENLVRQGSPAGKNIFTGKQQAAQPGQPYRKVTGEISVSYRAVDVRTNKTLDAALIGTKVNAEYDANTSGGGSQIQKTFHLPLGNRSNESSSQAASGGEGEPTSPNEVNERMLKVIAIDIARRVVNTDDTIEVPLARGHLDAAAKLGESGLWSRMLEQLESMPPFEKPEDDAYRLYDIGVAYEAMGYSAADPGEGLKFFEQAAVNYGKALDMNPREKNFREPQNRVQTALLITETLKHRGSGIQGQEDAMGSSRKPTSEQPQATAAPTGDADVLTNDALIDLKKTGMDDENLIANIKDYRQVSFDLSITGQRTLMAAGISNRVVSAMRERNRAPSSAALTPAKTSKPKLQSK